MRDVDWKLAISDAVTELAQLKYFPSDDGAREGIMRLLLRLVEFGRADQLTWLVRVMVDRVGVCNGPVELRGVFCTRFKPADGIEADCSETAAFSPAAMEVRAAVQQLPAPEARALLAGVVDTGDSDDVQAILDSIERMPGPQPNASGRRMPARSDRERELVVESVKDQLQPGRRRQFKPEDRAKLAAFYRARAEELDVSELAAPTQEGAGASER
jgi:hypothetical protein